MRKLILATILALVLLPSFAHAGWFYGICSSSIDGGGCYDVGPYSVIGLGGCKDWCGSQLFSFPPRCVGICNKSCPCPIIGDGYAYPIGWPCTLGTPDCPNPVPTVPDCYCTKGKKYGTKSLKKNHWYFSKYDVPGEVLSAPYNSYGRCERALDEYNTTNPTLLTGRDCFGIF